MIKVKRFNGEYIIINADLIEFVEEAPHTIITTITGNKILSIEKAEEIVKKVIDYKAEIKNHLKEKA